ncbi:MAG TPA: glycosyl hydrolase family 28-related protein, partial [Puia sp.]|nr:glycosyl hydrolase family 28-related protein [Puia sp.]
MRLRLFPFFILFCHSLIAQKTKTQTGAQPASSQTPGKIQLVPIIDTTHSLTEISIKSFGAVGDGRHDDITAFEAARDYVITHPAILVVPAGSYFISRPLLLQYIVNGVNKFFTIHLKGTLPNKSASATYLSNIICGYKSGYGIGIQYGRGIVIENITITGQYMLPYR